MPKNDSIQKSRASPDCEEIPPFQELLKRFDKSNNSKNSLKCAKSNTLTKTRTSPRKGKRNPGESSSNPTLTAEDVFAVLSEEAEKQYYHGHLESNTSCDSDLLITSRDGDLKEHVDFSTTFHPDRKHERTNQSFVEPFSAEPLQVMKKKSWGFYRYISLMATMVTIGLFLFYLTEEIMVESSLLPYCRDNAWRRWIQNALPAIAICRDNLSWIQSLKDLFWI